jgi:HAD superfamily hydrolase (TIGR01509 family)
VPSITSEQFAAAITAGDHFLAASLPRCLAASLPRCLAASSPEPEPEPEPDDYHRLMLRNMGVDPTSELLADLRREVPPATLLETYPEVVGALEELSRRGVRMAVVSDAWPNLPDLHAGLGIGRFFEAYAISAVLGCNKPDPRMYHHASAALELAPAQCLFVDDDPELVAAAIELGYAGRAVCRGSLTTEVPSIASLAELLDIF